MEFVIGVVAVCLAIISVPWLKKPIEKVYRSLRTKWTVMMISKGDTDRLGISVAIQKGTYQQVQHDFMICDWDHEVRVDKSGSSETSVTVVLVNISNESVSGIAFPMYFSGGKQPPECWAKVGSQTCGLKVSEWDERLGCGYVWIDFPETLQPRDDIRLNYGYGYPKVYENGSNWWEWFIGRPHSVFTLKFIFDDSWQISNLRGMIVGDDYTPKKPKLKGQVVYWHVKAPVLGTKYRLEFDLQRI